MKHAFQRKLTSQRGASLLLALLFLLISSVVSASILMAAVANAGKYRSNTEEHQTYLALSSAVSLICDELNRSQYCGAYHYWEETTEIGITRHLSQQQGTYRHSGTEQDGYFASLLLKDFDVIFAKEITARLQGSDIINEHVLSGTILEHSLTLTPQTDTSLDDREVKVTMKVVEDSYAIELVAWLEGMEEYQIWAELTPTESKPTLPALSTLQQGTHTTQPMKWKIGWITKGGEETEE